jgi:hypothetical protein
MHAQHDGPTATLRRRHMRRVDDGVTDAHRYAAHGACHVERRLLLNLRNLGRQEGGELQRRRLAQHRQRGARRGAASQA